MSNEQCKTYIETIQAHLERCENGTIEDLFKPNNGFVKVPIKLPSQVRYFQPTIQPELDEYGNIK